MATRESPAVSNLTVTPGIPIVQSPRSNDSILLELKQQTSAHHRRLETEADIWTALSSPARYRRLISRMFGIYSALESRLRSVQGLPEFLPDLSQRWKIPMLTADVAALGLDPRACEETADAPELAHIAAAFGGLYVLEGSTLGGQLISRQVHAKLGLTPGNGCRFFFSYGENVGQMWKTFGQALESFAAGNDTCRCDVVEGAVQTFACFSRWFSLKEHPV